MFIRKKKNKSGKTSVQIIDKSTGKYKVLKTIGCSSDPEQLARYCKEGRNWIKDKLALLELDFYDEQKQIDGLLNNIEQINIKGTELLIGKIYNEIGFDKIEEKLLKHLVMSRICFPVSKLKTTEYLYRYHSIEIDVDRIYRYLDKLIKHQKERIQQISYEHTLEVLSNNINILFYDVTTLYFEINKEDELRKTGFSKEGKHQNPQIVLGLLVSIEGYPLAYEIFEGHTLIPVIESFKSKYKINSITIIADSGLLSSKNIKQLQEKGNDFILGARIKTETKEIKEEILKLEIKDGQSKIIEKDNDIRLIISYSKSRAKKDNKNRQKGLARLEKQIKSGKLTKANINKRGYNKYLRMEGETKVSIDKDAYQDDAKWDGLKGYYTNTDLSKEDVISNYKHLWKIEKAFRISKTDLRIRPIYHRLEHRIDAHICISFMAYKVYKEIERQLKIKGLIWSPEKAIDIAKTIYSIKIILPLNKGLLDKIILTNKDQKILIDAFKLIS